MKKMVAILLSVLLSMSVCAIYAEEFSVSRGIENCMLINNPESHEKVEEANEAFIQELIDNENKKKYNDRTMPRAQYIELIKSNRILNAERTFSFYNLDTTKYSKQYAANGRFNYLISPEKNWCVVYNPKNLGPRINEATGERILIFNSVIDITGLDFLSNPDAIEEMVKQEIDEKIIDCKIVYVTLTTILYLKGEHNDYGIKLYNIEPYDEEEVNLEKFKIYPMSEIMESLALYELLPRQGVFDVKPTYEAEAQSLQSAGLLQGNENGLDLLKPLTRIEAATMLLRAMGESTESRAEVQTFTDVPSAHWGYGAAENAYSLGLIKGVGEDRFAPDDKVTAPQFATMLLRAGNHAEFNWEEAVNILIEENVITAENAATMDFFTRGDMAKMIYEAMERGLF